VTMTRPTRVTGLALVVWDMRRSSCCGLDALSDGGGRQDSSVRAATQG